ncbi:MAG: hypothetical protein AB7O67_11650 [Vicinamibacterales bacterium]
MNDRDTLILSGIAGAAAGVALGYFFFTSQGRRLREDVEPNIEALMREAGRLRAAVDQIRAGIEEFQSGAKDAWPRRFA